MSVSSIVSRLVLRGLEYYVLLGWPEDERLVRQLVVVDISLRFALPPAGCLSDQLTDTYCYAELTQTLAHLLAQNQYRLLEHLGYAVFQALKAAVDTTTLVTIRVKKRPPLNNVTDGVFFFYGEENLLW